MRSKKAEASGLENHKKVPSTCGDEKSRSDAVGYGRPPKATRFAPGKSGNPKGRPRGARTVGAILQEVVRQKITVTENGKKRRVPALEGMLRRLVHDGLRGDAGAVKLLLSLVDRHRDSSESAIKLVDILAEDREILARYLERPSGQQPTSSEILVLPTAESESDDRGVDNDGV
jgi:Family of unknown function (DUF5681)